MNHQPLIARLQRYGLLFMVLMVMTACGSSNSPANDIPPDEMAGNPNNTGDSNDGPEPTDNGDGDGSDSGSDDNADDNSDQPDQRCQLSPPLQVAQALLDASLVCSEDLSGISQSPVLLVPGTANTPDSEFSWNYVPALTDLGIPFCTVEPPLANLGDAQISAEYVVNAIRTMANASSRKVKIIGYSQGGMMPRWALKYWPDTRELVDEFVSLSASNHGTITARASCSFACDPAFWQQRDDSLFLAALNDGPETFPGIDYSSVYTNLDEVVVPNSGPNASSILIGGGDNVVNIALQQVCPLNIADHFAIGTYDAVAWALALDAIQNDGPAVPSRLPGYAGMNGTQAACATAFMPGVNPFTYLADLVNLGIVAGQAIAASPDVTAEPSLACYTESQTGSE